MDLPADVAKLLIDIPRPANWVPDEYDVGLRDIMVDWPTADSVDVGIVGVPFDTAVMGRRGCRFGPEGVRSSLVFSNVYDPSLDVDLSTGLSVTDFGNIDVLHTEVLGTHERVEQVLSSIYALGVTPVIIGGDHSLSYPDIKALMNNTGGRVGVIMIDGHLDVRHSHHGEVSSGTPFRRLMEEPSKPLRPCNLVEVGINGWLNSRYYMDYCREMGVTVIPARQVHRRGIDDVITEALERASDGTDAIFLSIDIDGLDLSVAPGTCAPSPGGLSAYQALEMVWQIGQHPLSRGLDVMEIAPSLDSSGVTSMMGAALIMHYLGATKTRLHR
ncbi:MAG TPA: agmatinase [Gammaproteobacteria bacterium]|jgi:formimidoylglutamase|nr:agmatinase [Acidiferrobacteraceae bacterium]MDP6398831.1 agmatinase family protein [Arenicellales bacterium]HCX87511.1 agmatinase [Gammaproteobacteria bacterium]MDP6550605.1 agmatinase family protein [Arenicellales bacterium]MDP6791520.1 agmatinase family protein [Arenicellales bacterium]|tara:strand:- start:11011 stop:11997 length:987 start_codon:yes stop_codon:yes gene_type:complete